MGIWDVLKDVSDTFVTVNEGYNKVNDSKKRFTRTVKGFESQWYQIDNWERKKHNYIVRTVVLCVLIIVITILVCIFL